MARPRTSTRDLDAIVAALAAWLQTQLSLRSRPAIEVFGGPTGGGFSSDTVLFDLIADGVRAEYVLRLPPPPDAFPLFPWYDLERQVRAMRSVRKRTDVPVPHVPWFEPDPGVLGAPFYVMERINGRAPSDVPPYVLDGWVLATTPEEQLRMLSGVVGAIAGIHDTALYADDVNFFEFDEPGDTPLRRHVAHQRTYYLLRPREVTGAGDRKRVDDLVTEALVGGGEWSDGKGHEVRILSRCARSATRSS
jgi:aminoglycoside phosphotransferase (APT) family kinase protein